MVQCWKYDPRDRPSFAQLVANFIPSLDDDFIEVNVFFSLV